jgi:hypothetical protein
MTLAKGRKLLDVLAKNLATLGSVTSNGTVPSYPSLRSSWSLPAGKFLKDNTSGFDEPYELATGWNCRRHRCDTVDILHDRTKADLVMEVNIMQCSHGGDVTWIDDLYQADWLACGQNSWKKQRELDVRHLSNHEFEAFKTIVDRAVTHRAAFNTWCQWHYRCTLEQIKYFYDRKAINCQPWPFYFESSYALPPLPAVDQYLAYADPVIVAGATRVFPILNKLKL